LSQGRWIGSPHTEEVGIGSRFVVDAVAAAYGRAVGSHVRGRLLDLGCGKTPLYGMYKSLVTDVICVDWASTGHDNKYLDCIADLNQLLPFGDGTFDSVLLTDVLEHVFEPIRLVSEISRILRPAGKLIVGVPFLYPIHTPPHEYFRYTAFMLRRMCLQSGLEVIELEPYGGALEVILDMTAKHITRHPWLSRMHQAAGKWLLRTHRLRSLSDDQKHSFPLGYCLVAQRTADGISQA